MKKSKLIIASVLKPVDDTRMYEKFALSLGQTTKYEINIIGFCSKKIPVDENIRFHPIFNFRRLQLSRLAAPFKCLRKYIELKPDLIIINTHELLLVTALYKILFGAKIIYDIRENYYRNIRYTASFPYLLRPLIAAWIRGKEYVSRLFTDHYFLAEKQYENEFTFAHGKSTIIENKYKPLHSLTDEGQSQKKSSEIKLLFTGTIAESTGVFDCISMAEKLHEKEPLIRLDIVGFCAQSSTLNRLQKAIDDLPFIHLKGGTKLVTHKEILRAIKEADFGVICYPKNRSTINSMPTKLFEYLGNQLPILLQDHKPWVAVAAKYDACIPVTFPISNASELMGKMKSQTFYKTPPGDEILWISEEKKLLKIVEIITK